MTQELPPIDLDEASRFLDLALRCDWDDGRSAFVLLVEHWSSARHVSLDRTLFYAAGLRFHHPDADIYPVILVTDPDPRPVSGHLNATVLGRRILDFTAEIVRIGPDHLPRLRQLQSMVATVLAALAYRQIMTDAVDASIAAIDLAKGLAEDPQRTGRLREDLQRFLPLLLKLARMEPDDLARLGRRLREDTTMNNILAEWIQEGEARGEARGQARGEARGKAEGEVKLIRRQVAQGIITVDQARKLVAELIADGDIPPDLGAQTLAQLG